MRKTATAMATEEGKGLGTTAESPRRTQMAGNLTEAQKAVLNRDLLQWPGT